MRTIARELVRTVRANVSIDWTLFKIDDIVFDALGLMPGEREAVYEAVVNLVQVRLEKARGM